MCKKIIGMSVVVALVLASSSFADLVQDLGTQIGVHNAIDLLHGSQQASSLQNLVVQNNQSASGVCQANASQNLLGAIGQVGNAQGNCALIGLIQDLQICGNQSQQIGQGCDPKAQTQDVGMAALQTVARADGDGAGNAIHTIVLNAGQNGGNASGSLNEASSILGMQNSSVTGDAGSTSLVHSLMNVTTSQMQGVL
jgi:hypothetical protein